MRRNKSKVNSVETGCTVIVQLFPWHDQECYSHCAFLIMDYKILSLLPYLEK